MEQLAEPDALLEPKFKDHQHEGASEPVTTSTSGSTHELVACLPSAVDDDPHVLAKELAVASLVGVSDGRYLLNAQKSRRSGRNVLQHSTEFKPSLEGAAATVADSFEETQADDGAIIDRHHVKNDASQLVPTENSLFADPKTGRVESIRAPPPSEDPVTPVTSGPPEQPSLGSHATALQGGHEHLFVRLDSLLVEPCSRESQSANQGLVTKSSVALSNSMTSRRNSLGRLLNPLQSVKARIHPVIAYGVSSEAGSDDEKTSPIDGMRRKENVMEGNVVPTYTVQVAAINKTLSPSPTYTQRIVYMKTRESVAELFETPGETRNGRLVVRMIFVCIFLNVAALACETCDGQNHNSSAPGYPYLPDDSFYKATDAFFTVVFTIEFIGRMATHKRKRDALKDIITWIDLLALCPGYLQLMLTAAGEGFDMGSIDGYAHNIGMLRLLRIVRLGHILRNFESMKILVASVKASVPPLLITIFFLFTLVMLLATAIFYAEPCYNLNTCPFTDIFNSAYFIMVTVATVGYGNQVPDISNVLAVMISFVAMVFGQLYLSMPLAIVGNNFQDTYELFQQSRRRQLRQQDTASSPFDYVKLHRKSQRLCEMQYHFLRAWRVVQLNIDKLMAKNREAHDVAYKLADSKTSGQIQLLHSLLEAQNDRMSKIKSATDSLLDIHTEACQLLQTFTPHKRRQHVEALSAPFGGDSVISQVYLRARRAMANTRFASHDAAPTDAKTISQTRRGKIWLTLEVPDSSQVATSINRVMVGFAVASIMIFFCESLPELMDRGIETSGCRRVVEDYCDDYGQKAGDGGCFMRFTNNSIDWNTPLDFHCSGADDYESCYGCGLNVGSSMPDALQCVDAFNPKGVSVICYRMQCITSESLVNMEPYWIYFEWVFGITFVTEITLRFYATNHRRSFFRDIYNIFDALAVLPFVFEFAEYLFFGVRPSYAIVATSPSFFSVIRVLKTARILKLTRHFRGARVLAQTANEVWRQLLIPMFFLLILCMLAAAVFFEVERGTECFAGEPCVWWKKDIMTTAIANGLPEGKRVLIQDTRPAIITDMLRSTWLSAATFTTVGYGDVRPRTPMGRMFTILIAMVGTIYTSMPITLVGGKFRTLYARHAEKIVVRRAGSSASWKTKRTLFAHGAGRSARDNDSQDDTNSNPKVFKLTEDELEMMRQFQSMKRTFQNLQRHLDNLQESSKDVQHRIRPQRHSILAETPAVPASASSINLNMARKTEAIEHAIDEKSNAILDTLLQFSVLVEKLQDAPPFYEAILPESTPPPHHNSELERLVPPEIKNRMLRMR